MIRLRNIVLMLVLSSMLLGVAGARITTWHKQVAPAVSGGGDTSLMAYWILDADHTNSLGNFVDQTANGTVLTNFGATINATYTHFVTDDYCATTNYSNISPWSGGSSGVLTYSVALWPSNAVFVQQLPAGLISNTTWRVYDLLFNNPTNSIYGIINDTNMVIVAPLHGFEWYYLTFVISNGSSGGFCQLYTNGILATQTTTNKTVDFAACRVYLGRYHTGPYAFNGRLGEVRIYNRALASNEIFALPRPLL